MGNADRPEKGNSERAVIDHVADELIDREATTVEPMVHSPTTGDGSPVEAQVQKKWDPKKKGGLPTFLK